MYSNFYMAPNVLWKKKLEVTHVKIYMSTILFLLDLNKKTTVYNSVQPLSDHTLPSGNTGTRFSTVFSAF